MAAEGSSINLRGKGSSFTSPSVYKIASGVANVRIDSSAIERFSTRNTPSIKRSSLGIPEGLTNEEARASLAVILNKLILSTSGPPSSSTARSVLPIKILNSEAESFELGEIDVTEGENIVLEKSFASLIGLCKC
ncbi:PREDICTED: histidine--tRNA ligase, cytoplasmic-like isoform X2 [Camelina sativa]|uniref:Histidine--tRNA ligase, cytoplasmic-like isoform X2 n=1 Tax=Camelina sativa TaxID=90675 RepID=A0ABM0WQM7_CAMSA|nr:PREDICTED: histidine--tRNA ligase, cytoplasmic-like isoform X2 [Camelina sativa]